MHSPDRALQSIKGILPNDFYQQVERAQRVSVKLHGRPENQWCYFNALMDVSIENFHPLIRKARATGDMAEIMGISCVPTLALWRMTKGFYEFDQTLFDELLDADLSRIPTALLSNLPEYCVYIPLNGMRLFSNPCHGVFMHLAEFHATANSPARKEFRIVTYTTGGDLRLTALDLVSDDLYECFEATLAAVEKDWEMVPNAAPLHLRRYDEDAKRSSLRDFARCLSLALYLCSDKPDIAGEVLDPMAHSVSRSKKARYSYRAPMHAHILQVGFKFGGAIRMWREQQAQPQSDSSGLGMPKSPHVRRGHWHLYRTGKGRTIPVLKWLHPMLVNVRPDQMDDFPVTARPVLDDPAKGE